MKHRGSSKIKYEHHMIPGLRTMLENMEQWAEITSIIPGKIARTQGHRAIGLQVKYETLTGVKCICYSGDQVQEVFFVVSGPESVSLRQQLKEKLLSHGGLSSI
jgi:hypothetical protein